MADDLSKWLDSFPAKLVEEELAQLEREAVRIEVEIRNRRRLLEARNQYLGIAEDPDGQVRLGRGDGPVTARQRRERDAALRRRARLEGSTPLAPAKGERVVDVAPVAAARRSKTTGSLVEQAPTEKISKPKLGDTPMPTGVSNGHDPKVMSRAAKLLWFLGKYRGEAWRLSDIRDRLVQDGLLSDSDADTHGLQVTASRLYRTGRLERPKLGYYRLPAGEDKEID